MSAYVFCTSPGGISFPSIFAVFPTAFSIVLMNVFRYSGLLFPRLIISYLYGLFIAAFTPCIMSVMYV